MPPKGFQKYTAQAERWIKNRGRLRQLLREASTKLRGNLKTPSDIQRDLKDFGALIQAYIQGEYRELSFKPLIWTVAAVLYFVNPFDLIPDFIPGTGLIDDIGVIHFVISKFGREIEKYRSIARGLPE